MTGCLLNGAVASAVPVTDRGLQYGDGLFETLRVAEGQPEAWAAHCDRLVTGCRRLAIPEPDVEQLRTETRWLFADGGDGILKIWYSRGAGGRGYASPEQPEPHRLLCRHPTRAVPDEPARLRLCTTTLARQPLLAGIKHLNRLEQILARREWTDPAIDEGLLCDTEGFLVEAVQANLFWVHGDDGVLETPDLSACGVAGIMRHEVLAAAGELGIPHRVVRRTPRILEGASEVFITNSVMRVRPVADVDGLHWTTPGLLTSRLRQRVGERLQEYAT
jgi:4-amino-4-deoxychorismate lyase